MKDGRLNRRGSCAAMWVSPHRKQCGTGSKFFVWTPLTVMSTQLLPIHPSVWYLWPGSTSSHPQWISWGQHLCNLCLGWLHS